MVYVGYFIVTIAVAIIGLVGNTLVVGAFLVDKRLRNLSNMFICNLAVADLFVAGIIHPFSALGIIRGGSFYEQYHFQPYIICEFLASFCIINCSVSVLSIMAVALNRYIYICHNQAYSKLFTRGKAICIILGIWILGIMVDLPNFLGLGRHVFHIKQTTCFFDTIHVGYKIYFIIIGMVVPLGITFLCYVGIVKLVFKNKRRVQNIGNAIRAANSVKPADVKLLKTVAVIGILGLILYTPFVFTLIFDNGHIPHRVWMFATGLMHSYSCINWAVYALTNKKFRDAYVFIFKKYFCCFFYKNAQDGLDIGDNDSTNDTNSTVASVSLHDTR